MFRAIEVMSRREADRIIREEKPQGLVLLSMNGYDEKVMPDMAVRGRALHHLRLLFDDTMDPDEPLSPKLADAEKIVQLIDKVRALQPERFIVHCEEGISRSVAAGLFIASELECSPDLPDRACSGAMANRLLAELLQEAREDANAENEMSP